MKYRLTDVTKVAYGVTLYQIEALEDFKDVKAGDKGGWVANDKLLKPDGTAWLYEDTLAFDGEFWGGEFWGGVFRGGEFQGGQIDSGVHKTNPILILGSRYFVGWSGVNGQIRSGCILKPISWWDDNLVRCAEENHYTPEQIEEYKICFDAVKKWMVLKGVDKE